MALGSDFSILRNDFWTPILGDVLEIEGKIYQHWRKCLSLYKTVPELGHNWGSWATFWISSSKSSKIDVTNRFPTIFFLKSSQNVKNLISKFHLFPDLRRYFYNLLLQRKTRRCFLRFGVSMYSSPQALHPQSSFLLPLPDQLLTTHDNKLKRAYRIGLNYWEECTTGMADKVFVNSQYTQRVFRKTFWRLDAVQIEVLLEIMNVD